MTVRQLRKILKQLPKDMSVLLSIGDSLEHICPVSSQPLMLEFEETSETEMVFVLSECTCEDSEEEVVEELIGTFVSPN